jgi:SHS2 domain-containing protein
MKRFDEIPHTADWSFRAYGRDLPELFENAAAAVFALEGAPASAGGAPEAERTVRVEGIDHESLLVNWLSELLYMQESHRETYHRFHVTALSLTRLTAHVAGRPGGHIDKLIKAVTFHNLDIHQTPEGWETVVVVDV